MDLQFECPHCKQTFVVNINEINCGIFRHAVYKKDLTPIYPHETQINCEQLVKDDLVYGCTKPFQIVKTDDKYTVQICDYI